MMRSEIFYKMTLTQPESTGFVLVGGEQWAARASIRSYIYYITSSILGSFQVKESTANESFVHSEKL